MFRERSFMSDLRWVRVVWIGVLALESKGVIDILSTSESADQQADAGDPRSVAQAGRRQADAAPERRISTGALGADQGRQAILTRVV